MKYLLVEITDNWADEFDTTGFILATKEELDEFLNDIKNYFDENPNSELSYCIGTNQEIEHDSYSSIERCLTITEISEQEYKIIKKRLGESFGETTLWEILAYN